MADASEIQTVTPSGNIYIDSLLYSQAYARGTVITYVFQSQAGTTGFNGGTIWSDEGRRAGFNAALQSWTAVAQLTFVESAGPYNGTGSTAAWDWVESFGSLPGGTLGRHDLPATGTITGTFNIDSGIFFAANMSPGGYAFTTFAHEIGHGLGLLHPFNDAGDPVNDPHFPGVNAWTDYGDNGLDQGVFTVMTYLDGYWQVGLSPTDSYGWEMGPMAFDIAAIQRIYGANLSTGSGANSYTLPGVNAIGTGWKCLWDAGGTDTIQVGSSSFDALIDLRAATLLNAPGGGGYVSRIVGILGGFTIANGVVIENATGGGGDDWIHGNAAANVLDGGSGWDTVDYSGTSAPMTINLAAGTATGAGSDSLLNFENARGGEGNDTLTAFAGRLAVRDALDLTKLAGIATTRSTALDLDYRFSAHVGDPSITLAAGQSAVTVHGVNSGGEDWYSFYLASPGSITVDIDNTFGMDTIVEVFDANGVSLGVSDDATGADPGSANPYDSLLTLSVPTGDQRLYVRVTGFNGSSGTYDLNVSAATGRLATTTALVGSRLEGGAGNDVLIGGLGIDTAVYSGSRGQYAVQASYGGALAVTDTRGGSPDGADSLSGIERLQFADLTLGLSGVSDFNGDGLGDVLFRSRAGVLASWQLAGSAAIGGGGTLGNPGGNWRLAAQGDFNGDGTRDLLFVGRDGTLASWQLGGTAITGGGTIGNPGAAWSVVGTGDYNGDGKSDVLFLNAVTGAYASWDLNGTAIVGGGTIGTPGSAWVYKASADFNGDGKTDILFQNANGSYAIWTLNDTAITGGGTIGNPGAGWFFKGTGDFNSDGRADLLFQNADGRYATWDLNGTAIVGGGTIGNPGSQWVLAGIGDYSGDARSDLVFRNTAGSYASWALNDFAIAGGGTLGNPGSDFAVAAGRLGGGSFASLVFQSSDGTVAGWTVGGLAHLGGGAIGNPGGTWVARAVGDVHGTGETDVLFQDAGGTLAIWKSDGAQLLGGGTIGNPGAGWSFRGLGDFNGDGKADLLFQNGGTGAYASWDLNGTQIVGGGTIGTAAGFSFAGLGDMNGDGKADMLFVDSGGTYASWLMDDFAIVGGGTIGNPGAGWTFKGLGDFNGDGKADLLFQNTDGSYATWDLDGTQIVGGGTIGNPGSQWSLAKIVDLNADGRADLLFADAQGHYAAWLISDTAILAGGTIDQIGAGWTIV